MLILALIATFGGCVCGGGGRVKRSKKKRPALIISELEKGLYTDRPKQLNLFNLSR